MKSLSILLPMCAVGLMGSISFSNVDADNTKVNRSNLVTADQQGMTAGDTEITRLIRQDLVSDKHLSAYAQNVKIITIGGRVTLRGPVRSKGEERVILKYARSVSGVSKVTNQLEIARAD